jgi:uncharacterized OB-fold protein
VKVEVPVCGACGHAVFPPRALCPLCAAAEWNIELAETGTIEELTERDALVIAAVRLALGPVMIARADPGMQPGDAGVVRLEAGAVIVSPSPRTSA